MIRSLLFKLAMLAVTLAVMVWIGRPTSSVSPGNVMTQALDGDHRPATPALPALDSGAGRTSTTSSQATRIDVNRATAEELQRLPGIGPVLAQAVLQDRATRGRFRSVEDLKRVKGIGTKRLERLRPLVVVSREGRPVGAIPIAAAVPARERRGL
ncbi:MAG: ComEA family DNA-binding protein [Nitrospirae bacterium]|nr:ComEA family DNA-binding protein [Nitrospirota bacterium]